MNDFDIKSVNKIRENQKEKLKSLLHYVNKHSKFYSNVLSSSKIDIDNISSIEEIEQLPFTSKDDLANYNDDFLCVDLAYYFHLLVRQYPKSYLLSLKM